MSFTYSNFKKTLIKKFSEKLTEKEVDELLTFEQGFVDDKFPQKRLVLKRVLFNGTKSIDGKEESFAFDKELNEGLYMLMADNLKGKSSVFKIIKFALTGDNDIAVDVKNWLKNINLEFKLNDITYTVYLNVEKQVAKGYLYKNSIEQLDDEENRSIIFEADSALSYKASIQEFFFNEFQFYHLNWTQKSSHKDKNELLEAKASWNTYFESVYLTSRASTTLAFGNQEELIFQMLLGLKLTYPINRLKTRLEKTQFDLAKLRDVSTREIKNKAGELKKLEKQYDKLAAELDKLKNVKKDEVDLSKLYENRNEVTVSLDKLNSEHADLDNEVLTLKRLISQTSLKNQEITSDGKRYKELIAKARRSKTALEEHIQFGIFFSNLDIKICPHCNTHVTEEKKKHEKETKECMLCTHKVADAVPINADGFQQKIASLDLEIQGYEKQLEILRSTYTGNKGVVDSNRNVIRTREDRIKEVKASHRESYKLLREIDKALGQAKQNSGAEQKILELEKQGAVLEYRLESLRNSADEEIIGEVQNYEYRIELLGEALEILKVTRTSQNEEIITNFKQLLLEELHDLGISAVSEVTLSDTYKISYNLNGNWVTYDKISEGEQLRIKIAFYLSIIQLDIKYNAGKHPRLLIIDSPNKEEGDSTYVEGLKKLLANISQKYKNDLQIIIGTASRELNGAVSASNTITYPKGAFVF